MIVFKWINRYSGECGYIKVISTKERHFINTTNLEEAKKYSKNSVERMTKLLAEYGELDNNDLEVVSC